MALRAVPASSNRTRKIEFSDSGGLQLSQGPTGDSYSNSVLSGAGMYHATQASIRFQTGLPLLAQQLGAATGASEPSKLCQKTWQVCDAASRLHRKGAV